MRIWEYPPIRTGNTETDNKNLWDYLTRLIQYLEQKERETEGEGGTVTTKNGSAAKTTANRGVVIDTALDATSENPVQNMAIATAFNNLATVATSGSYNDLTDRPVIPPGSTVDTAMSDSSENAVQNKVIKAYVDAATGGGGGGGGGGSTVMVRSCGIQSLTAPANDTLIDNSTVITYTGYTPIGIVGLAINNLGDLRITGAQVTSGQFYLALYNPTGSSITTGAGVVYILYTQN